MFVSPGQSLVSGALEGEVLHSFQGIISPFLLGDLAGHAAMQNLGAMESWRA